jgi:hypothetical protein
MGGPGCGRDDGTPVHYSANPPDATWPPVISSARRQLLFPVAVP